MTNYEEVVSTVPDKKPVYSIEVTSIEGISNAIELARRESVVRKYDGL